MKPSTRAMFGVIAAAIAAMPASTAAHFKLLEPASWLIEDDRGDPQWAGPCGGTNTNWGKPSYAVTNVIGETSLHIKVQETAYHPGFYRVALAVNSPLELPLDPKAETRDSDRGPVSVSGAVQNPPQIPVLADGLFTHRTRPTGPMAPWETDVKVPNITCKRCTLQVIQFMEEHSFNNPGGYTYHHCAALQIIADRTKPLDTRWPAERDQTR